MKTFPGIAVPASQECAPSDEDSYYLTDEEINRPFVPAELEA